MPTIKDVALFAKVSTTTVSHVINKTRVVSSELTDRVQLAMNQLNYHPNALARSLRIGSTKTIGLITPDISNLFFAEIARYIEDYGHAEGFSVILCNTDNQLGKESSYIQVLIDKQIDGIIFISSGDSTDNLKRLREANIPVVVTDRDVKDFPVDVVLVDNLTGGMLATEYLIKLGHTSIAHIAGPSTVTPSAQRTEGYRLAMKKNHLQIIPNYIFEGDFRIESGEQAMNNLLSQPVLPTAVFISNDMMAFGAVRVLYEHGLKIPDDISIVGYDDTLLTRSFLPPLTTIAQPMKEMAVLVTRMLIKRIKESKPSQKLRTSNYERRVLEVKLVERNSCKKILQSIT